MKIKFAKFFQYVDVPKGNYDQFEPRTSINNMFHDIDLDGIFVKITHRDSGCSVIANVYNVAYFRTEDEQLDTGPKVKTKGATKTTT